MIEQIGGFLVVVKHESQAISPGLVFGSPNVPLGEFLLSWVNMAPPIVPPTFAEIRRHILVDFQVCSRAGWNWSR